MSAQPEAPGLLSIGEVIAALRGDFPDISASKVRYLESEGLITPIRTTSGYRKFRQEHVRRLHWILTMQRDEYLPLRVIRERVDAMQAKEAAAKQPARPAAGPSNATAKPAAAPASASDIVAGLPVLCTTEELMEHTGLTRPQIGDLEQPQLIQSLTLASATYTFDEHVKALVPEVRASASPGWVESIEAETRETHGAGYAQTLLDLWVASVLRENELPFTPDDLKRIACWTLILHGDRDQFFPVRIPVTMYQAIPNAELGIAPGHGHTDGYLPLFMPALLNFLGQHPIVQSTA